MKVGLNIRVRRLLSISILAMLLGAQFAQAGHFHAAEYLVAEDCLQCSLDCGQAIRSSAAQVTLVQSPARAAAQAASPAPFSAHYRLAARGPPSHSC